MLNNVFNTKLLEFISSSGMTEEEVNRLEEEEIKQEEEELKKQRRNVLLDLDSRLEAVRCFCLQQDVDKNMILFNSSEITGYRDVDAMWTVCD